MTMAAAATRADEGLAAPAHGSQVLVLTGLRFDAALGVLPHENAQTQPIAVDAELHLGAQPLLPKDDDILHVLDYRAVRKIILEECASGHVNLLETLMGKLAHRLLHLPNVLGVRLRFTKLELVDDGRAAVDMEAGAW